MANRRCALRCNSIGATLTDTLDDLITAHRIDPQLAMKILANFDRAIAEVLQDKVKARLTFKVRRHLAYTLWREGRRPGLVATSWRKTFPKQGRLTCASLWRKQGSLDTYRFCDEVWTFLIKNVSFKMDNGGQAVMADKVKIVSCNAKRPGEGQ